MRHWNFLLVSLVVCICLAHSTVDAQFVSLEESLVVTPFSMDNFVKRTYCSVVVNGLYQIKLKLGHKRATSHIGEKAFNVNGGRVEASHLDMDPFLISVSLGVSKDKFCTGDAASRSDAAATWSTTNIVQSIKSHAHREGGNNMEYFCGSTVFSETWVKKHIPKLSDYSFSYKSTTDGVDVISVTPPVKSAYLASQICFPIQMDTFPQTNPKQSKLFDEINQVCGPVSVKSTPTPDPKPVTTIPVATSSSVVASGSPSSSSAAVEDYASINWSNIDSSVILFRYLIDGYDESTIVPQKIFCAVSIDDIYNVELNIGLKGTRGRQGKQDKEQKLLSFRLGINPGKICQQRDNIISQWNVGKIIRAVDTAASPESKAFPVIDFCRQTLLNEKWVRQNLPTLEGKSKPKLQFRLGRSRKSGTVEYNINNELPEILDAQYYHNPAPGNPDNNLDNGKILNDINTAASCSSSSSLSSSSLSSSSLSSSSSSSLSSSSRKDTLSRSDSSLQPSNVVGTPSAVTSSQSSKQNSPWKTITSSMDVTNYYIDSGLTAPSSSSSSSQTLCSVYVDNLYYVKLKYGLTSNKDGAPNETFKKHFSLRLSLNKNNYCSLTKDNKRQLIQKYIDGRGGFSIDYYLRGDKDMANFCKLSLFNDEWIGRFLPKLKSTSSYKFYYATSTSGHSEFSYTADMSFLKSLQYKDQMLSGVPRLEFSQLMSEAGSMCVDRPGGSNSPTVEHTTLNTANAEGPWRVIEESVFVTPYILDSSRSDDESLYRTFCEVVVNDLYYVKLKLGTSRFLSDDASSKEEALAEKDYKYFSFRFGINTQKLCPHRTRRRVIVNSWKSSILNVGVSSVLDKNPSQPNSVFKLCQQTILNRDFVNLFLPKFDNDNMSYTFFTTVNGKKVEEYDTISPKPSYPFLENLSVAKTRRGSNNIQKDQFEYGIRWACDDEDDDN